MKTIKQADLAQYKHVKFLKVLEKQANLSYKLVMKAMLKEIQANLREERLAKSDDGFENNKLGKGWTGEVPTIEINLEKTVGKVVDKYLLALKWVMMGDYAGKKAREAAEEVGLVGKVTPGVIPSAYLQSIDSHRQHHLDVLGEEPVELPKNLMKASLKRIVKRTERFLKQTFAQIKTNTMQLVDRVIQDKNMQNMNQVFKEAHDSVPIEGQDAVGKVIQQLSSNVSTKTVAKEFNDMVDSFENKWNTTAQTELSISSALGTHQSMYEIYGNSDSGVRVVWMEMEDEKVCRFCRNASKKADGTFKYYKLSDFKPSGYNYGKKISEWLLTIPPVHPRCRCDLVYVPVGFDVDSTGSLIPRKR